MAWWRGWFGRQVSPEERKREQWRKAWAESAGDPRRAPITTLTAQLDALHLPEEDIELEREMLDGLSAAAALAEHLERGVVPVVETGHRAVAGAACHLSAPASMPDEPSQPSGRLLMTSSRAIFVGGSRTAIPWHAVSAVQNAQRDLVLIRLDRETLVRFRFNSYADAMSAALLARRLMPRRAPNL